MFGSDPVRDRLIELLELVSVEALALELYRRIPAVNQENMLVSGAGFHVSEIALLDSLVPSSGKHGSPSYWVELQCISRALRFRAAQLNMFSHISVLRRTSSQLDANAARILTSWAAFIFAEDISDHLEYFDELLPCQLLTCSVLGIHVVPIGSSMCRYYEPYERLICSHIREQGSLFCAQHQAESWWLFERVSARSATMLQFHCEPFEELMSEAQIASSVGRFFSQMRVRCQSYSAGEVELACQAYGYSSADQVRESGAKTLRRVFLEKVRLSHPDRGGTDRLFIECRRHYEILNSLLVYTNCQK